MSAQHEGNDKYSSRKISNFLQQNNMFLSICEGVFHIEREERGEDQHNFLYNVYQKYFPIVYNSRYEFAIY